MDAGEGDSDAIPFSRPHPRSKPQTVVENLHRNWNIERGHVKHNNKTLTGNSRANWYIERGHLSRGVSNNICTVSYSVSPRRSLSSLRKRYSCGPHRTCSSCLPVSHVSPARSVASAPPGPPGRNQRPCRYQRRGETTQTRLEQDVETPIRMLKADWHNRKGFVALLLERVAACHQSTAKPILLMWQGSPKTSLRVDLSRTRGAHLRGSPMPDGFREWTGQKRHLFYSFFKASGLQFPSKRLVEDRRA